MNQGNPHCVLLEGSCLYQPIRGCYSKVILTLCEGLSWPSITVFLSGIFVYKKVKIADLCINEIYRVIFTQSRPRELTCGKCKKMDMELKIAKPTCIV